MASIYIFIVRPKCYCCVGLGYSAAMTLIVDDEETLQLAREIMEQISPLCVGHPHERVIAAIARVCSAVTSACASETSRADDLRAAAGFLLAQAAANSASQEH